MKLEIYRMTKKDRIGPINDEGNKRSCSQVVTNQRPITVTSGITRWSRGIQLLNVTNKVL